MIITDILRQNNTFYPEKAALIERTPATGRRTQITWSDFYGQSVQTANALQAKGVKKRG
jgi:Acyl-CoA synthetases (AMP-forming)/AMP-acid ligases II